MKLFKNWTKFEKVLLILSIVLVSTIGIVFKSDLITTICSLVGITTALLLAKGKPLGQVFGLFIVLLYSIVSYKNKFYGEVIIYLVIMLPMYILGIISWLKHQNKKTNSVDIEKVSKKEWILVCLISIACFIGIYFLLKLFNTNELFISSLSVIDSLFAVYLQIRRSKFSFYFYVVNDLVLIVLWGIPCLIGNVMLIPMLLNPIINLVNDIYGIINWQKIEIIQGKK